MTQSNTPLTEDALTAERPAWPAIRRGLACRCPKCGEGALLLLLKRGR